MKRRESSEDVQARLQRLIDQGLVEVKAGAYCLTNVGLHVLKEHRRNMLYRIVPVALSLLAVGLSLFALAGQVMR